MTIREELDAAKSAELITVNQVALLSQYDPQTIYRKAKRGEIPGLIRWGRGIRFNKLAILGWVKRSQEQRDIRPIHTASV